MIKPTSFRSKIQDQNRPESHDDKWHAHHEQNAGRVSG